MEKFKQKRQRQDGENIGTRGKEVNNVDGGSNDKTDDNQDNELGPRSKVSLLDQHSELKKKAEGNY